MINGWPALRMLTFVSTDLLSLFRSVFPGFICSSHSFLMASTSLEHIIMDLRLHVLGFFRLSNLILFKRATFSTPSHYHSRFHFHFFSSKVCARRCVGVVASGLCISRRLYSIASIQAVSTSHTDVSAKIDLSCSVNKLFRNVVWLSVIFAFPSASQSL